MSVKVSSDFMNLYQSRLRKGEIVYSQKFKEIRDARELFRQIMPAEAETKGTYQNKRVGNDPSQDKQAQYSHYVTPHFTAVAEKLVQDLSTNNYRFEWEGNNKAGAVIRDAFSKELLKIYTLQNINKQKLAALWHLIMSGSAITQIYTEKKIEKRIMPNGEIKENDIGRIVGLHVYDPIRTIVDYNANPHDVTNTADWCIVTIGTFSPEYVKNKWGKEVASGSNSAESSNLVDAMNKTLELEAGTDKIEEVVVREYYTRDGYRYIIVNDSEVVEKAPNSNGIAGRIPINFASSFIDPHSPYGMLLYSMLEPSIVMMSAAINQIADANALNNKMPFFAIKGALPESGITLNRFNRNEIIELDPADLLVGGGIREIDINKIITKFQFPDVSQSAVIMFEKAEQMIWILTGLSPETLGGIQTKQIRNSDVASMINQTSLRNTSKIVVNFETGFLNPATQDIARIFELYFDDFEFKEKGLTKDILKEIKNVRVVNGSYLPGDQMTRFQKLSLIKQLAGTQPLAYEHLNIEKDLLTALGVGDADVYLKNPEEMFGAIEWQRIIEMYASLGPDGFQDMLSQRQQMIRNETQQEGV